MNSAATWDFVQRSGANCWQHKTLPIWVVEYPSIGDAQGFYQGYIAVGKLIKDRHPGKGGVDNRRVGTDRGFKSLGLAQSAAIARAAYKTA